MYINLEENIVSDTNIVFKGITSISNDNTSVIETLPYLCQ